MPADPKSVPPSPFPTLPSLAFNVWVDVDDDGFVAYSGFAPGCVAWGATVIETLEDFIARYKERTVR